MYCLGNYEWNKDIKIAEKTEKQFGKLLEEIKYTNIGYNKNNKYDIKAVNTKGKTVTFELKEDFKCKTTGNVAVEYHYRGKDSGIRTTKANYYAYKLHEPLGSINFYCTIVSRVKKAIEEKRYFFISENGGDRGSKTKNYIFDINDFKKFMKPIFIKK